MSATDLPERFNQAIYEVFPAGDVSVTEVATAATTILSAYVAQAPIEFRAHLFRQVSAQLRSDWSLDAPDPAPGEARPFPDYLRPVETEDCNAVLKNGDGGANPLPVHQWGGRFTRIAYFVPKALRLKLRNERAVVSFVIKEGPGGVESVSAKVQNVELTTEH